MLPLPEKLSAFDLFDGIDQADLPGMLHCLGARTMRFARGETILAEGTPARDVGLLLTGRVQLIRTDWYGNRSIMLSIGPGQLFAEAFACAEAELLPVNVLAVEDCEVLLLDCRRLLTGCSHSCPFHSQVIFNLLKIVAKKNLALHRKAFISARRTTREKVLTYLLLTAKESGGAEFSIPFDRQGLADYLEVDRSGLSAELSKLRREGVLYYRKNHFRLLRADENEAASH